MRTLLDLWQGGPSARHAALQSSSNGSKDVRIQRKLSGIQCVMAELAAPVQQKAEQEVVATVETAMLKLSKIAFTELGDGAVKVSDQIAAKAVIGNVKKADR